MKPKSILRHQAPLGYLVHEVARLMKRRFEEEARSHGLTLAQWRALSQVATHDCITQREIADSMDADPMTVSGILDRLEKRGLIERYADPSDSRAKLARLTPAGEELFQIARNFGLAMYQTAIAGLSAGEREALQAGLEKMRANLSGQPAELEEV
ncbi:MAG: MarR family winged helix-turn-helix transcriptional regulator [Devosia sp.]